MNRYAAILNRFDQENRLRRIPMVRDDVRYNLSDNDYLGIRGHLELPSEILNLSASASASRLLACEQDQFNNLEETLAQMYNRPVRLYNSGYHANVGSLSALSVEGTLIVSDKLSHASMVDGIRLGGAESLRFRHNDVAQVEKILSKNCDKYERIILATESVFSMDGDRAPLQEFVALKRRYSNVMLYVDEAHGFGVFGRRGQGLCEEMGLLEDVDVLVGTFGKAASSVGAFVAADKLVIDFLTNTSRSLIFSTSLPPLNAGITNYVVREYLEPGEERRRHLQHISKLFVHGLEQITGEKNPSQSQIVPLMIGDAERAVKVSLRLQEKGVLALPIRRPTVPIGTERIRFSLNANLSEADVETILLIIRESL